MHKTRRSRATDISMAVKHRVAERDSVDGWPCCIFCGDPNARPEAHFISRAQGGLGIERNIMTVCRRCHDRFDNGDKYEREAMREFAAEYLGEKYPDWREEGLVYEK